MDGANHPEIEIYESRAKLTVAAVGCTLGTLFFAGIAAGALRFDLIDTLIVYLAGVVLGMCAVGSIRRLILAGRPVVTLTKSGLRDRRLFRETLPWGDVHGLGVTSIQGRSYLALRVAPERKRSLGFTPLHRFMSMLAFELPKDLLAVNVALMKTDLETLRKDVFRAAAASGVLLPPY